MRPDYQYWQRLACSALCLVLMPGCAAKRDQRDVPQIELPAQYAKARTVTTTDNPPVSAAALASPLNSTLGEWWRLLESPELNGLIDRALANNPDLRIATLRIAQSKARLDQAGSGKFPVVTMPIQMRTDYPEFGAGRGNPNGNNTTRALDQISLKADWRPDIWGETASLYESAELQILRATYQRDDAQRNVVANVANNYLEYLSLNDRLRIARTAEKSLAEMLESVNARMEVGDATITEMEQQKAAIYSVKATIPVLEQQREIVLNRLASLLGAAPVALKLSDSGLGSTKYPAVLPGVPSALLLRRPDVRAAEARLLAADADIDVARTRVLPPLDLTAQVGYGSMYLSQVLSPQSLFWNTIANLSVTIFDNGKRTKEVEFAQAMHEELLETYVRVIYDAVREVDDSLGGINSAGKRLEAQQMAADSSLRAWNYSQEAFMAGALDYIVLLDTQRTYQRNMDDLYSFHLDSYRSLITLFSSLGGGVNSGDIMPGKGSRPTPVHNEIDNGAVLAELPKDKYAATAPLQITLNDASPNKAEVQGVDWSGSALDNNATRWLVELSGVYDSGAILPAWRDLQARFPQQMEKRTLLPQRQGLVKLSGKERSSWYRLFLASFSDKKVATEFCAMLTAGQQRCSVVASKSLAGKGEFAPPKKGKAEVKQPVASTPKEVETAAAKKQFDGVDWSEQQFWLIEMSGVHDRSAIAAAWRNLLARFPVQLKNLAVLTRRQTGENNANMAAGYRLYLAKFPDREKAEELCTLLRAEQQTCGVVSSQSFAEKNDLNTPEKDTSEKNPPGGRS